MYKLIKLVALNFGNIVKRDFEFSGELTLISGANGSGKSTIEDLIQCGMTGDINNIVNYNAGQKEDSTKKQHEVQRSFSSYILGGEQLKFTRDEAVGIIALIFKNSVTGKTFTAWIYGEAEVEGKRGNTIAKGGVKELGFCFNTQLNSNDFLVDENKNKEIKTSKNIKEYLSTKYKKDFYICDSKKEYLMKLYATFNNEISMPYDDARTMAKAFVKYIYPTKADNINSFVKEELLDKNDLTSIVKDLRESIHTYSRIQKEAETIVKSEKDLGQITKECKNILVQWQDHYDEQYIYLRREYNRKLYDVNKYKNKLTELTEDQTNLEKNLIKITYKEEATKKELKLIEDLIEGNEKIQKRNELLEEKEKLQKLIFDIKLKIKSAFEIFSNAYSYLVSANQIIPISEYCHLDILNILSEINNMTNENIEEKSKKCNNIISEIKLLTGEKTPYFEKLDRKSSELTQSYDKIKESINNIEDQLRTFSLTGKQHYPNQRDINIIKECFPDANPIPLCELLDIKDTQWQGAIEGLLGGNRFAIVVNKDYEVEVTDLLREKDLKSKVIQGNKVLNDYNKYTKEIKYNSIVNLFTFENKIAEAYIKLNYGMVLQYDNTNALTKASRGLKKDGLAANGYATFQCGLDERDCYIGETTKIERHNRLLNDKTRLIEQLIEVETKKIKTSETKTKLLKLNLPKVGEFNEELKTTKDAIETISNLIDTIDIQQEEKEFIERISTIKEILNEYEEKKDEYKEERGSLKTQKEITNQEIKRCTSKIKEIEKELYSHENLIKNTQKITNQVDIEQHLNSLYDISKKTYQDTTKATLFHDKVGRLLIDFEIKNNDYIKDCAQIAIIDVLDMASKVTSSFNDFKKLNSHYEEQKSVYERLSENILRKKSEEVSKQKKKFHELFQGEFCSRVYDSIKEGENKRIKLNRILRRNKFGNESFLVKSEFTTKYKNYYDYFEYIATSSEIDQLDLIPENLIDTQALINRMLLDANDDEAIKELKAISDYRNFKEYDIHKVFDGDEMNSVSLSRLATDSGGQATTSYYIIRSIAAFSAFTKIGIKSNNYGLGFLMIDEAFNRVDESRTGDILNYLTKTLGFQLIVATPTDKEASMLVHATDKYQVYKQVVNSDYDNYEVKQFYDLFILNKERIKELLKNDKIRIKKEQGVLDL